MLGRNARRTILRGYDLHNARRASSLPCRLLQQVLSRFEEEGERHLLVATLCLLEVSSTGLLESELLKLLADEENLLPPSDNQEKGQRER